MCICMAINVSRAGSVVQPQFLMNAAAIAGGAVAAAVLTEYARAEVYDVPFNGGDFVYGLAGAAVTMMLMGGSFARMLAGGMVAGGLLSAASNDYNLI